jgi:acetolactate synthase I/II/III large subunit
MLSNFQKRFFNSGADAALAVLKKYKTKYVHGYSGGAILPLLNKFHPNFNNNIKFITHQNEQCAGHAAQGYAKSSGKTGVIATTSGPGFTNLVTPILDAYTDGDPLVILSAQVSTSTIGTGAFQEAPSTEITKSITKWNYRIKNSNEIYPAIDYAFKLAQSGRPGPVHIDIPKDTQIENVTDLKYSINNILGTNPVKKHSNVNDLNIVSISKIAELLTKSKKPIIIAGKGCLDCSDELAKFANKNNIPVTTTLHAMGCFDESNYLSLYMLGMHGSAAANYAIQEADLIIGLGTRFDDRTTGNLEKYAPKALEAEREGKGGIVCVDIIPDNIGKTINPTHIIINSCKNVLNKLNRRDIPMNREKWLNRIINLKSTFPFTFNYAPDNQLKTQEVIDEINRQNTEKTFYTTGVGNHQMMTSQFIDWKYPRTMITSGSLGTMGSGLPFAIGTQLANPDSRVVNIDGDGSFNMTSVDLATVVNNKLPIKIVLMNDSRQQMVYIWQKLFFDGNIISTENKNPDYGKLAEAYGLDYLKCDNRDDLFFTVDLMLNSKWPILVDFIVIPDMCTPLITPGKGLDEMILINDNVIELDGEAPC